MPTTERKFSQNEYAEKRRNEENLRKRKKCTAVMIDIKTCLDETLNSYIPFSQI